MKTTPDWKLIYLSSARIPTEKAHGYQILKMCEAFSQKGLEIELLHSFRINKMNRIVRDVWDYYDIERDSFKIKTLPAIDIPVIERFHKMGWYYLRAISYSLCAALYLSIQKNNTVIYSRDIVTLALLYKLKKLLSFNKKIFFEAHYFPKNIKKNERLYRSFNGIIVMTNHLKNLFIENGINAKKILVAHDAADIKKIRTEKDKITIRKELNLPIDKKIVGYLGRFHTMNMEKGIYMMIKSLSLLLQRRNDIFFCFVGGPEEMVNNYLKLAEGLNVNSNHLKFIDHIPRNLVPLYLSSFDICTIASPCSHFYAYYTSPMKLFEYMAAKKPIIATDLPSTREILSDGVNAVLVPPSDPSFFAEGIERILNDESFAKTISENAYQDVQNYTWEKRSDQILSFIEENS